MTEVFSGDFKVTETKDATGDRTISMVQIVAAPPPPPPPPPGAPYHDAGNTVHSWVPPYTWPSAAHHNGKTLMSWERWGAVPFAPSVDQYMAYVQEYDHVAETWGPEVLIGNHTLVDDTHGTPSIVRDHQGYWWGFYGSHNSDQRWAATWAPDDISGGGTNNTWNVHTKIAGTLTYPKPVAYGTGIQLFNRYKESGGVYPLIVRDIQTNNGVGSPGSARWLVRFDASRVYASEFRLKDGEIWFMFTRADSADSIHTGVYLARYDPVAATLKNHDGSFVTGTLPIDLTTADTNFRVIDTGTDRVELPSWCFVGDDVHFVYGHGNSSPLDLKHSVISGGTVSTPTVIGQITWKTGGGYVASYSCVASATGYEAWWPEDDVPFYTLRGGDRAVRSGPEVMLTASGPAVGHPTSVFNADPSIRVFLTEVSQSQAASTAGPLKRYGHGNGGYIGF